MKIEYQLLIFILRNKYGNFGIGSGRKVEGKINNKITSHRISLKEGVGGGAKRLAPKNWSSSRLPLKSDEFLDIQGHLICREIFV